MGKCTGLWAWMLGSGVYEQDSVRYRVLLYAMRDGIEDLMDKSCFSALGRQNGPKKIIMSSGVKAVPLA
jgi:hypothetical protein